MQSRHDSYVSAYLSWIAHTGSRVNKL
jgi:hypothetical protein